VKRAIEAGDARYRRLGIVLSALLVTVLLGVHALHTARLGRAALLAADAAMARGDWSEAVEHARTAAEAAVPGTPWRELGLRRLGAIGREAEMRSDTTTALLAYGAMRTAVLETRMVGSRGEPWRSVAEQGLSRLAAPHADLGARRTPDDATTGALVGDEPPGPARTVLLAAAALIVLVVVARGRP
jgi:hypothetical protein